MDQKSLQWHPAFYAALQIELMEEREHLQFYEEYNLTQKPLQIDVLVIRLEAGRKLEKNIGRIFRQHNIVEYKSPEDYISVNDFYKTMGYACLYQADTAQVLEIAPEEITITLAGNHYPRNLIRHLKQAYGAETRQVLPGIHYISGLTFPVQIVVAKDLPAAENVWLSRLRGGLKLREDIEPLAEACAGKTNHPLYEAVMDRIVRANRDCCEEGETMCNALRELFADELKEREEVGMKRGIEKGIKNGMRQGAADKARRAARNMYGRGFTAEETAGLLEESLETVSGWYEAWEQETGERG